MLAGGSWLQSHHAIAFDTDRVASLGVRRNRLGEGVSHYAVRAGGLEQTLTPDFLVIGIRSGNHQIQEVHLRGFHGEAGLVSDLQSHFWSLTGGGVGDTGDFKIHAGKILGEARNDMGSLNGSVKIDLPFRNMAGGAELVRNLWTARVFIPRGEIDIVMAGPAGSHRGLSHPVGPLRCRAVMAVLAILHTIEIRESNGRVIVDGLLVANNHVGFSCLDAWEIRGVMDFVDHYLHIHGIARIRI